MHTGTGRETTSLSPRITSPASQSRFTGQGEKLLFTDQRDQARSPKWRGSTSRLRDSVNLGAAVGQQATMRPASWLLNAVERRTARVGGRRNAP